jgi:hypothetical protein
MWHISAISTWQPSSESAESKGKLHHSSCIDNEQGRIDEGPVVTGNIDASIVSSTAETGDIALVDGRLCIKQHVQKIQRITLRYRMY